ncbi:stress protein [Thecamonas trahens ATCC 50062]|uniref:Stress protein n=1 Tax=Thecamonas trahens ATCC 50062 TaxID=461836 RepID=A0A0L0DVM9_THETB|nr:stress protein [Thecamonas trahens ATCC 50062]KNC56285.1 stress protein [Thecamonas trahens ATCC 50062]|eukprot:XP_013760804.1 stress protein [Thecamonas trahens ATCC 50062]
MADTQTIIKRGQTLALAGELGSYEWLTIGAGWESETSVDLDLKAVLLDENDKNMGVVDYSNLTAADGAVVHSGDNRSGAGEGDDESVSVNVNTLPEGVDSIVFLIAAFGSASFASVSKLTARLHVGRGEGQEAVGAYEVKGEDGVRVVLMARLFRENGMFKFSALGEAADTADIAALLPIVEKSVADKKPKPAALEQGSTIIFEGPSKVMVAVGWDTEGDVDLDLYSVLMDKKPKAVELVNYSNLSSENGSVQHGGDNRQGTGSGDDEHIVVSLDEVSEKISVLTFPITAYGDAKNWNKVQSFYIRLVNVSTPTAPRELARFTLDGPPAGEYNALLMATLARHSSGGWAFGAAGEPIVEREVKDSKTLAKALKDKMKAKAKAPDAIALAVKDSVTVDPRAVKVAMGWQTKGKKADFDLKALLLSGDGFIVEEVDFSNMVSSDGKVTHSGDDKTGSRDGDDEVVSVNLPGVGIDVESILFVVANYGGALSDAKSAFVRLVDDGGDEPYEIARHDMNLNTTEKALMVATLARVPNSPRWSFTVIAKPVAALRNADVASSLQREKIGVELAPGDIGSLAPPSETFVGMTWNTSAALTQSMADIGFHLFPFAALVDAAGAVTAVVSETAPASADGAVVFHGESPYDQNDAAGHYVKFPEVDASVHSIVFGVAHFDAHGFSQVDSVRARISDVEGGIVQEMGRYSTSSSGSHQGVLLLKMARDSAHAGSWSVSALGAQTQALGSEAELAGAVEAFLADVESQVLTLETDGVARMLAPQKVTIGFSWPEATAPEALAPGCYTLDAKGSIDKKIDHDKTAAKDGSIVVSTDLKSTDPSAAANASVMVDFAALPPKVTQVLVVATTKFAKKSSMTGAGTGSVAVSEGESGSGPLLFRTQAATMDGTHNGFVFLWFTRESGDAGNWIANAINRPATAAKQKELVKKFVAEQAALEAAARRTTELAAGQVAAINAADLLRVGVGWNAGKKLLGLLKKGADLDLVALLLSEQGKLVGVVDYKNKESADGALVHSGDDPNGKSEGENESIVVDLTKVSPSVQAMVFVITAYQISFKNIKSCFMALSDEGESGAPPFALIEHDGAGDHTATVMGSVFRSGAGWKIKALGQPASATEHDAVVGALDANVGKPQSLKLRKGDCLEFEGPTT